MLGVARLLFLGVERLDVDICLAFELKDGRVMDGREHFFDLYAWDEFW